MEGASKIKDFEDRQVLQRYKLLFDTSRDVILFIERDNGSILEANDAAEEAYGYDREEFLNLTIGDLRAPDSIGSMAAQMAEADHDGILFETSHQRKDGTIFPVEVSSRGATINGTRTLISVVRDIGERKRTEEALKASENNYRTIFENTQDMFYRIDSRGIIVEMSPSCMRYSGYAREEFIGRHVLSFYDNPEDGEEFLKTIQEKGEVTDFEVRIRSKDGRPFYVSANARLVPGPSETEFRVEGTLRDVTQRKLMEKALQEKEMLLRATLESTADGILAVDELGRTTHMNARFAALWGISPEVISTGDDNLMLQYVLDQLEEPELFLSKVRALYQTSREDIDTLKFKDGRFFERYSCPLFREGKNCGRVWSFRDVTERKQHEKVLKESELKYRRIFESLEDMYYQTDDEGRIRILSPSTKHILGWSPEELIGRPASEVYVDAHDRENLLSTLAGKGNVRDYDVMLRRKDGTAIQASVSGRLLFDDEGHPDGVAGVLRDITDRKKTEEALQYETAFLDAVINCSQEGIYLLDVERQKVLENQRARDLWKMTEDVDDNEARVMHMVRSLKDSRPFVRTLAYLLAHPKDSVQLELELKDGKVLAGHTSPINGKGGRNYGRLWTFRDITELRHYANTLKRLSQTDPLTSLANRRRFDEVLEREWQRAIRNQSSISLLMADIDFFKAYNDRYGHPMGDECLRLVASAVASKVRRPSDLSARYGGEEFACILPDTDLQGAMTVAWNILGSVRALNIPHASSDTDNVTVSIGVAASAPTKGQPVSQLIETADRSLYQAKLKGRDQAQSEDQET